jgi:cytosine/adenosine deaminase-related metal-dependent hydrolase
MVVRRFRFDYQPEGEIIDIVPAAAAGMIYNFSGILSPGFVNCHCHLELSHMKAIIPEKTGMIDFLVRVIQQRGLRPTLSKKGIEEAENSMQQNGIVAWGDICKPLIRGTEKAGPAASIIIS